VQCETNTVHLRDERGSDHLVLADMVRVSVSVSVSASASVCVCV